MDACLKQICFLAVIMATSPFAFAQSGKGDQQALPLFSVLDANEDGALDPFEALDRLLMLQNEPQAQTLNRQTLTRLLAHYERDRTEDAAEFLKAFDKNKDQRTEIGEIDPEFRELAAAADHNKDGALTPQEFLTINFADVMMMSKEAIQQEVTQVFSELDKDQNNSITKVEATGETWAQISESDADRNSEVSRQEFQNFLTMNNTTAVFEVKGDRAMMSGVIAADTPARVLRLIFEAPRVRIIEMRHVPGSIDDEANLRAARYIRQFGFTTLIRSDGMIASGGTDFFLAGVERYIEPGARLGIHSWGGPGYQGKDVPRDDPQHRLYLDFYAEMGIPAAFYWRTLEAAPAEDIHWMTEDELNTYQCRTGKMK